MNKYFLTRKVVLPFILFLIVLIGGRSTALGQLSIYGHYNCNAITSKMSMPDRGVTYKPGCGISLEVSPIKSNTDISFSLELRLVSKGYSLDYKNVFFDTHSLNARANTHVTWMYFSVPILINYKFSDDVAFNFGIDFANMIDASVHGFEEIYNERYIGTILGITAFPRSRASLFARVEYGFNTTLKYYEIDRLGNFVGEINDFRAFSVVLGVKLNLFKKGIGYHEEV